MKRQRKQKIKHAARRTIARQALRRAKPTPSRKAGKPPARGRAAGVVRATAARRANGTPIARLPPASEPFGALPRAAAVVGRLTPASVVYIDEGDFELDPLPLPSEARREGPTPAVEEPVVFSHDAGAVPPADLDPFALSAVGHDQPSAIANVDLFDAAGNLRLPQAAVNITTADQPSQAFAATPPQPMPPTRRLAHVNALSLAGVVRVAAWPLRALYWPWRMRHLRRQQQALQLQYNHRPTTAVFRPGVSAAVVAPSADVLPQSGLARWSLQFIALCVGLLLPLQIAVYYQEVADVRDRLMARSAGALTALREGRDHLRSLRLAAAAESFQQAEGEFQQARSEYAGVDFFTQVLLELVPRGRRSVAAGLSLLTAGEQLAHVGQRFSSSLAAVGQPNGFAGWPAALEAIADLQANVAIALPSVAYARTVLDQAGVRSLGLSNRDEFLRAVQALPEIESTLLDTAAVSRTVLHLLGRGQWQRYLVLFENNTELRATGGFIGSFGLMDVADGRIINLEIPGGGSYDLQGRLLALVKSPQPLRLINPRWEFHDANWWPDFPSSARKAAWFIEQSRGGSVDGVIAVTNTVLERMLEILGPIAMPEYGRTITAENFTAEAQKIVELEYDRTINQPKLFLAALAPKVLEQMSQMTPEQWQHVVTMLYRAVQEKHLMVYSGDAQAQQLLDELEWSGRQQPSGLSDYLMVVNTNIAGGKTDRVVATSLRHEVVVSPRGQLTVTLTITRTHQGQRGDPFTGVQNNSYLRVYVPGGSQLLTASGFAVPEGAVFEPAVLDYDDDVDLHAIEGPHQRDPLSQVETYQEQGKTVFAHWLAVTPGEQKSAMLEYRLPFTLSEANGAYTLLAQKQPGTLGDELLSILRLGSAQRVKKSYPSIGTERLLTDGSVVQFHERLVTDAFWGTTVESAP